MESQKFLAECKRKNLKRGFYQNDKGSIRWLHGIQRMGPDIFIVWATKRNALATLSPKHKGGLAVQGQNVDGTKVANWFLNAKYIGSNAVDAGLVEENN